MIEPTEQERAALADLEAALVRGTDLGSAGARRKELRGRLDELAGRLEDHPSPAAWLEAREGALDRLRQDLGREIEELRGEQERSRGRFFPGARAREIHGQRIRKVMDLLEVLGRLAEIRLIRERLGSTPPA